VISLLGRAAVLAGLAACSVGVITGVTAALRNSDEALRWTRMLAWVFALSMFTATALMEAALLTHDFSVSYVAEVGSRSSPTWVSIVSLWSSLNGSILLWGCVLGGFTLAFTIYTRDRFAEHTPWALACILGVGVFFTFLIAGVANPFAPVSPVPPDGPGANPLLQNHILMVIHPPALYLGYVGMTVPFGMACATLLAGRLDAAWVRALRRWMLLPWGFLSVGIILGGWWSYEVLGWGGWWAWDPVENASFLPWLTATAFIHSAMVMERNTALRGWTLTLVLATFLLTLLGTFMTRSGVFNSVHSFTQSPIGPVFLGFFAVCLVACVLLLSARVDLLAPPGAWTARPASREASILVVNLLLTCVTFTVLLGTVYPLLNEALTGKQISVGQPYFDRMGAPLGVIILFLMGVGPSLPWGEAKNLERLVAPTLSAAVVGGAAAALGVRDLWPLLTVIAAGFAGWVTVREMIAPIRARAAARDESIPTAAATLLRRAHRRYGGYTVHAGILCIAVAHAIATAYSTEHRTTFSEGAPTAVGDYTLTYQGSEWVEEPHRRSMVAHFDIQRGDRELGAATPRLNHYPTMGQPIGTPAVLSGLGEDLYLNLVNVEESSGTASLEVLVRPLVWWLWFGGGLIALGISVSLIPGRKRAAADSARKSA